MAQINLNDKIVDDSGNNLDNYNEKTVKSFINDRKNRPLIFIIALVVIFIICILYMRVDDKTDQFERFIFGSWDSDIKFNNDADIKSLKIFIGPIESKKFCKVKRQCYIHIDGWNNDKTTKNIISNIATLTYNVDPWNLTVFNGLYKVKINFVIENVDYDNNPIIPKELFLELDIFNGYLKIYGDNNKLYGFVYKDNSSTHILALESLDESDDSDENENLNDRELINDSSELV